MTSTSKRTKSTSSDKARITRPELYMRIAETVALRSACERLGVGTVITDSTLREIKAIGYNGGYAGGPNTCDRDEPGNCGCIHSEINALLYAGAGPDRVLFVTHAPCAPCAKAIVNSKIRKVYYRNDYSYTEGLDILREAKISVRKKQHEDI